MAWKLSLKIASPVIHALQETKVIWTQTIVWGYSDRQAKQDQKAMALRQWLSGFVSCYTLFTLGVIYVNHYVVITYKVRDIWNSTNLFSLEVFAMISWRAVAFFYDLAIAKLRHPIINYWMLKRWSSVLLEKNLIMKRNWPNARSLKSVSNRPSLYIILFEVRPLQNDVG